MIRVEEDWTPQKRAARATMLLIFDALQQAGGITTREMATALGVSADAAWKMLTNLCGDGGIPLTKDEEYGGRWFIPQCMIRRRPDT